jgi:hypothetical protein
MALWQRQVPKIPIAEEVYEKRAKNILEFTGAQKMVGVLRQLGALSEFAADIFNTLFIESTSTAQRIGKLGQRIEGLEQTAPALEKLFATKAPREFYGGANTGKPWRRRDEFTHSLFLQENQPGPIQQARMASAPPPAVSRLDQLVNKECLRQYSDPQFFLAEWLRAEEERQKQQMEEIKKRGGSKKKPQENKAGKGPKTIETIGAKVYNTTTGVVERTEIKTVTVEQPVVVQEAPSMPLPQEEEASSFGENIGAAPGPPELPPYDPNQGQTGNTTAPLPPSPTEEERGQQNYNQAPAPPIPAYSIPDIPVAPVFTIPDIPAAPSYTIPDPPDINSAPEAPAFDAPSLDAPQSGAPTGGYLSKAKVKQEEQGTGENFVQPATTGLLADLQKGPRNLKKASERKIEKRPTDARSGMLDEIRNRNTKLRHVKKEDATEKKPAQAAGGHMSAIMAVLARRAAIKDEDDGGGDGDDDWAA